MPAVVREYVERGTFEDSLDIQRQLIAGYKEDIRKYAEGLDRGRILNVFNQIPPQLAKDNKKFQISKVASGAGFKDYSHGIKLTEGNVGYSDNIYTFPYFCTFLLKRYLKSGNSMI